MAIENSIIFGGVNSADFGIYISGEGVFNAPKRDVEMITIPGRNGAFALDNGRFENIEVTYPAFNFEPNDYDTFAQRLSDFRNAICAQRGYQRLEDTFHPDEYRMAAYIGGLDIKPIKYNTASEFDIVFDCKPQRWLKDGETAVTIGEWGETETASGDIVTVENPNGVFAVKSLEVDLEPIQSGSGTPSPDNVRPISGHTDAVVSRSGKNLLDTSTAEIGTAWNGASNSARARLVIPLVVGQTYTLKANGTSTLDAWYGIETNTIPPTSAGAVLSNPYTFTATTRYLSLGFNKMAIASSDIEALKLQLELGSTATTYEPYQGTTYTTALGRTVYGGTLDVTSGVLTVDKAIVTFNGASGEQWEYYSVAQGNLFRHTQSDRESGPLISKEVYCNRFEVVDNTNRTNGTLSSPNSGGEKYFDFIYDGCNSVATWKTWLSSNNVQVVYPLATPQTYQLTAQQISLLTGDNNIWSDGDVTLEYGQDPSVLFNPTLFESSPLLETAGSGTIQFNGYEIGFEGVPYGEVEIRPTTTGAASNDNPFTRTYTLDTSLLNTGDPIYPEAKGCWIRCRLEMADSSKRFNGVFVESATNVLDAYSQYNDQRNIATLYLYPDFGDGFVYGTAATITCSAEYRYTVPGYTRNELIQVTIDYAGADTYTITVSRSGSLPSSVIRGYNLITAPTMYGNSSKPITDPISIDCDLGEAYIVEDGVYISLNSYIDLGSELPTLGVGANEVTFDNTITELKVTPRWWKV